MHIIKINIHFFGDFRANKNKNAQKSSDRF